MEELNKYRAVNVFKEIVEQLNQLEYDDDRVDECVVSEALKQYQVSGEKSDDRVAALYRGVGEGGCGDW